MTTKNEKISYLFKITTEKEELFTKQKYIDGTGEIEVSSPFVSIIKVLHFDHTLNKIYQCSLLLYRFTRIHIKKAMRRNMKVFTEYLYRNDNNVRICDVYDFLMA